MSFWSPGYVVSPRMGHERLSISSSAAGSASGHSLADHADSLTPESITFSPVDLKLDPDDAADLNSAMSPVSDAGPTLPALPEDLSPTDATQVKLESTLPPEGKRRRGRPRKHPVPKPRPQLEGGKANNGRSKTGCITCRRRKKKCDEGKPGCLNCKKNNVACEGYKSPTAWQAGRHKANKSLKKTGLPPLFDGVQDEVDALLLRYFISDLSNLLCLGSRECTPLNDLILPMTVHDRGLMHSVLCLSGYKLAENTADEDFDETLRKQVFARTVEHCCSALELLGQKEIFNAPIEDPATAAAAADDSTIAQIMMLCLHTIMAGDRLGEYRTHLKPLRHIITSYRSSSQQFQRFSEDFLLFHSTCSSITCTASNRLPTYFPERFRLPGFVPPEAGSYFGILDGLFLFLHQVTELRDHIRERRLQKRDPAVDFPTLHTAQRIDDELRDWTCHQPEGTTYETASLLYHKCTWIYLHRTILPSVPDRNLKAGVDEGLRLLKQLRTQNSVQAILVMPLFLLGCSAFEPEQRPQIIDTFDVLLKKRGKTNLEHAQSVVKAMWTRMDAGDESSWDWETLMSSMQLDFLVS